MVSLTKNEARAMNFLIRNFSGNYNINQLAKELEISPRGIFKILKKLEKQDYLSADKRGNNIFYRINYLSGNALDACKFALIEQEMNPYAAALIKDLEKLKEKTELAILFGSVLAKGKEARDIDLLLVFEKNNLESVEKIIDSINKIRAKKVHAVYQTKNDFSGNIKIRNEAVLEEIKTGLILWGRDFLVEVLKNEQNR